jgi:hypothetical protein
VSIAVKARPDTTHGSWVACVKCVNRRKEKLEFRGIPPEKFTLVSKTPAPIEWKPVETGPCEHIDPETGKMEDLIAIVETKVRRSC